MTETVIDISTPQKLGAATCLGDGTSDAIVKTRGLAASGLLTNTLRGWIRL